jgi:hypothetical protein
LQELAKPFYKIDSEGRDIVFGIRSNPSLYTQGEFGGVTQELVRHDGQTSPNGGEN